VVVFFETTRHDAGLLWRVDMKNGVAVIRVFGALLAGMALLGGIVVCHSFANVTDRLLRKTRAS
jgi:uncharacterized membrane protein